jgi:hypothetical protein
MDARHVRPRRVGCRRAIDDLGVLNVFLLARLAAG